MNSWLNILTNLRPRFDESTKIAIKLGNISITWYAVIILTGALIGAFFGYFYFAKRLNMTSDLVSEGLALGLLLGIIGARLYYVAFSGIHYDSFWEVINPRSGGLAIHGAVIAVVIYLPIWCKIRHIDLLVLLEIALPLIMFAQVVGRWGNFINQEAFGELVKYPGELASNGILSDAQLLAQREWLHKLLIPNFIIDRMYISSSTAAGFSIAGYYQPTFLFESVLNLIGLTLYMTIRKFVKKIYVGDGISFYLIWYGGVRIFIESLRSDPLLIGNSNIKVAQVISIIFIIVGVAFAVVRRILKYRLTSCYDALYKEGATMIIDENKKKEKINNEK